jgi:hypothetical protein
MDSAPKTEKSSVALDSSKKPYKKPILRKFGTATEVTSHLNGSVLAASTLASASSSSGVGVG